MSQRFAVHRRTLRFLYLGSEKPFMAEPQFIRLYFRHFPAAGRADRPVTFGII
jgi:hypothetical protein